MKKVLFLIHDLGPGGAEKVLVNLVNNLDKKKYDVSVLALFGGGINEQYLKPEVHYSIVFKNVFPGNSRIMTLFSPRFLYKKFIKAEYDIVISYLEGPSARIVSGCNNKDVKLVSWIHCKIDTPQIASIGFRNFKEAKQCYQRFHYTVCVSEWVKQYFTETFSFDNTIGVLYNTNETKEILSKAKEEITDIVFSKDCFNICSVGKVAKVKSFERLIEIHKKLLEDGIKNHVYILGTGAEQAKLEKRVHEYGLEKTFTFMGYNTNPYKYVKNCDLYVCSSLSEGFSTAVTEALIVGTPVVTTLCSGMQEMLGQNNEYGIVTLNNEEALYQGIKRLLENAELLKHYKEMAQERGKYFSTENTVRAVEEMLDNLLHLEL